MLAMNHKATLTKISVNLTHPTRDAPGESLIRKLKDAHLIGLVIGTKPSTQNSK